MRILPFVPALSRIPASDWIIARGGPLSQRALRDAELPQVRWRSHSLLNLRVHQLRIMLFQPLPHGQHRLIRPADVGSAYALGTRRAARRDGQALVEHRVHDSFTAALDERDGFGEEAGRRLLELH